MRRLYWFFRRLLNRRADRQELAAELEAANAMLVAELRDGGMSEADARRAARLELGSETSLGEETRDAWAGAWFERAMRDVRYALRGVRRNPGFAVACIVTLGLAIGGTATIASLADAMLIRPLPFERADRLMMVMSRAEGSADGGQVASQPNIADWRQRNRVFEALAYFEYLSFNVGGERGSEPQQAGGLRVSHELFPLLRARPLLGRGFTAEDDAGGSGAVVILSHALWHDQFGGDSSIVGRTISVNKQPHVVVGVMPEGFHFPATGTLLWTPMQLTEDDRSRGSQSFFAVARLRDGIDVTQALGDMQRVGTELAREYPDFNAGMSVNVFPMRELWMQNVERIVRLLAAAVLLITVMATVNVAGLTIARGSARTRELGARLALGSTRGRLVGQLMTESLVVALLGALLGILIAFVALPVVGALPGLSLANLPFRDVSDLQLQPRVLVLAVLVAIAAGLATGLLPALSIVPRSPVELMKQGGGAARRGRHVVRTLLLAVQVGLAVVVLVGAGLLIDSVRRATSIAPGLDARDVTLMTASLPQRDTYGVPERPLFCAQLQQLAVGIPGLRALSAVSHVPLTGQDAGRSFTIEGRAPPGPNDEPSARYGVVCPEYFRAMSIPLRGRDFGAEDRIAAPQVAIVNEAFQKRYFGAENAVGKRFHLGPITATDAPWITIVAVAGDVRHHGLVAEVQPYLYRPYTQTVWPRMTIVAQSPGGSAPARAVRTGLRAIIPDEPVGEPMRMSTIVDDSLAFMRFPLLVMSVFGGIALFLVAVGVFGVASQITIARTRELGIRRALGSTRVQLYRLVVVQTLAPAALGLASGLIVARASTRLLSGLLYGVSPTSPVVFAEMTLVLAVLTVLACVRPAHRASSVDPARTLRTD